MRCFVLVLHLRNRGMCAALECSSEMPYIMRFGEKYLIKVSRVKSWKEH